jgi:malate dehydrogenase (oxaloacetate-decarboxylating)(NADP+)
MDEKKLAEAALKYHSDEPVGKIFTGLGKPVATQLDLSLAYSPGVATPCLEIEKEENDSFKYTGRGNLVGVVTNGSAVLGLGNIGPYAAKPVMEGKAMLFKKFADIDVFDIELDCADPDDFIKAVRALEPTFGGINLEDIKAPECFYIEETLREQMNIPVFHDDQHGTAIIAASAFINALEITKRDVKDVKVVFSGAGAAAIACASLFVSLGVQQKNLLMCDSKGVINTKREGLNKYKMRFANDTKLESLADAMAGADAFVGVSVADILTQDMVKSMAKNPIIFALANPDPEITPDKAREVRPDAIIATGRSDFPNQVNNVLGFPFIFRGALDVRATVVNEEMKLAAVKAIADLAKEDVPDVVMEAYDGETAYRFGRDYLIPKPVDPRVLFHIAPAVAKAAMDSGVARRHIDMDDYKQQIERVLGPTQKLINQVRRSIAVSRKKNHKAPIIAIPFGFDRRIIKAASQITQEGEVRVCLLGSEKRILGMADEMGLKNFKQNVEIINPLKEEDADDFAEALFSSRQRKGVSRTSAVQLMRNHNYYAAMMLKQGQVDGVVAGVVEPYIRAAVPIIEVIGTHHGRSLAGIYIISVKGRKIFFADCTINIEPDAETLADIAITTAEVAKIYSTQPVKIAMLSFASFGASKHPEAVKVGRATEMVREKRPDLEIDGEMQADMALDEALRGEEFPFCDLKGQPNVLIFPNLSSANISYKLLTNLSDAEPVGPLLVGVNQPANVLQRSATTNEIVNMIYMTAHQAIQQRKT